MNYGDQLRVSWSSVYLTLYTTVASLVLLHLTGVGGPRVKFPLLLVLCAVTLTGVMLVSFCARSRWFRAYRLFWFATPTTVVAGLLAVSLYHTILRS